MTITRTDYSPQEKVMDTLFVVERSPSGDVYRTYDGMTLETITALVSANGNEFSFITEDEFISAIDALAAAMPMRGA